jgi:hypothetical protein
MRSSGPLLDTRLRNTPWPDQVIALLRAGKPGAGIAQIKVAPGLRELRGLEKALAAAQLASRWASAV